MKKKITLAAVLLFAITTTTMHATFGDSVRDAYHWTKEKIENIVSEIGSVLKKPFSQEVKKEVHEQMVDDMIDAEPNDN